MHDPAIQPHDPAIQANAVPLAITEPFDDFYRREFPAMVALAASVGAGPAAAEDLAQDAMVKAHRHWAKISRYDRPGAWVRRVTINAATSRGRRATSELKAKVRLRRNVRHVLPPDPPSMQPIWAAVGTLPPQQRAAIALHYLEDMPVAQIAEVLECAPSTAKVHLHKARGRLAEILHLEQSQSLDEEARLDEEGIQS